MISNWFLCMYSKYRAVCWKYSVEIKFKFTLIKNQVFRLFFTFPFIHVRVYQIDQKVTVWSYLGKLFSKQSRTCHIILGEILISWTTTISSMDRGNRAKSQLITAGNDVSEGYSCQIFTLVSKLQYPKWLRGSAIKKK